MVTDLPIFHVLDVSYRLTWHLYLYLLSAKKTNHLHKYKATTLLKYLIVKLSGRKMFQTLFNKHFMKIKEHNKVLNLLPKPLQKKTEISTHQ